MSEDTRSPRARPRELAASFVRTPYAPILAAYVALRFVAAFGVHVTRALDTESWLQLDFSGSELRLWTVPLFFKVLPSDTLRVFGQVAVSTLCWAALAGVTARYVKSARVKPFAFAAVLVLGLVTKVTNWDTILLGESLAISLTVAAIAAWWAWVMRPTWATTSLVCAIVVLWGFLRHTNIIVSIGIALLVTVSLVIRERRAMRAAVLASLVITIAWALPALNKDVYYEENLATIFSERILTSPERTEWFADHGMPDGRDVRKLAGSYYTRGFGSTPIRNNKRFFTWLQKDGRSTYFEFLLTHPGYTFGVPVKEAIGPDTGGVLSGNRYGKVRTVVPEQLEELVFGDPGQLVFLSVGALTLALLAFGVRGWSRRELVPVVALVVGCGLYWLTFHGVASEPERHYLVAAVMIRVALFLLAILAIDRLVDRRAQAVDTADG